MRPVSVSQVDLSAREQELELVLAVLNEHAARVVGQPTMHLPHRQSVRHGVLAPAEPSLPASDARVPGKEAIPELKPMTGPRVLASLKPGRHTCRRRIAGKNVR